MIKIQVKYEKESEKEKVIKAVSKEFMVTKISPEYKSGRYRRIYLDIK